MHENYLYIAVIIKTMADQELEEAKAAVLQLMNEKDKLESEIQSVFKFLDDNNMKKIDGEWNANGYPLSTDGAQHLQGVLRKLTVMQSDQSALMNKIEKGLHKIHKLAAAGSESSSSTSNTMQDVFLLEPFLRVDLVSSGSPAELAGLQVEDLILKFGSITNRNFKTLKDIGALVQNSRYKDIYVKIKRGSNTIALTLIPRPWSGNGLLGCNVVPLEAIER